MKSYFVKNKNGLVPDDEKSQEWFGKLKPAVGISVEVKKVRNYLFLKKYFALVNLAFLNWEPPKNQVKVAGQMITPEKNYERFREDLTILAGHYETVFRIDGSYRIQAKSISFAKMEEDDFDKLYQATITVLIQQIWQGLDIEDVEKMVEVYLGFA